MPVSASKLVTLAQLQAQAERVKQELAKYTLASELGSLAKKSEISEADLSAALKSVIDGKMDAANSMTTEAINSAIATAIAKSAHLHGSLRLHLELRSLPQGMAGRLQQIGA